MFFKKNRRIITVGDQKIELEPKPSKSPFSFLKPKQKKQPEQAAKQPVPQQPPSKQPETNLKTGFPNPFTMQKSDSKTQGPQPTQKPAPQPIPQSALPSTPQPQQNRSRPKAPSFGIFTPKPKDHSNALPATQDETPKLVVPHAAGEQPSKAHHEPQKKGPSGFVDDYVLKVLSKQKGLEASLREQDIKATPAEFVKRMLLASLIFSALLVFAFATLLVALGLQTILSLILGLLIGIAGFQFIFKMFLDYPSKKKMTASKSIERDIMFAARDMIISLRSGMPLYNAITSISTGYGDASKEFAKIVEKVQLGMPLEQAIDSTIEQSKSPSFRKIMLQASVSIRAGADVVSALQSVIDQLSQERIIELRSYGQRLNALAMFYMLFGVILPSMGIAVLTILTTFVALFTVTTSVLAIVLVFIVILQLVFLKLITSSRPVFTM